MFRVSARLCGLFIVALALCSSSASADSRNTRSAPGRTKPINLPSCTKLSVDMHEVRSGHMVGGSRLHKGSTKDIFPSHMTERQVESAIREACKNAKKLKTQGDSKFLVEGHTAKLRIQMWINAATMQIETAYPQY